MIQRYSWKSVTMLRVQNKLLINSPQVYLPAIEGHVPNLMVCMTQTFLSFCYIAWCDIHDTNTLAALDDALFRFQPSKTTFSYALC